MMTGFSVLRSRLTGTLTTPGDTGYTAGVDAFNSTIWHRSDAVVCAAFAAVVVETGRFARRRATEPAGWGGRRRNSHELRDNQRDLRVTDSITPPAR